MRRSEMLALLEKYILNEMGDSNEETHIINSKIDASELLKIIEKAGMTPPEAYFEKQDGAIYNHSTKTTYIGPCIVGRMRKEWEPEDET
jgi:hypothetical protein